MLHGKRALEKPLILKSVRMSFLLPFHADYGPYIHARDMHYLGFGVRIDFITFARSNLGDIIFLGFILQAFGADAPALEIIQAGFLVKWHALIGRGTSFRSQDFDDPTFPCNGLAIFFYR